MRSPSLNLAALFVIVTCSTVRGAQPVFDSAADSAYNSGWANGSDGGFGWGSAWNIGSFGNGGAFVGSSATNGSGDADGDGDINSPRSAVGRAWGLNGQAIRTFGGPLTLGQTFSIDFDDRGFVQPNVASILYLLDPDGSTSFSFTPYSTGHYVIIINSTVIDTGVADTDQGVHLTFTEADADIQFSITPYLSNAPATAVAIPYSGQLGGFELFALTGTGTDATYINNISITPEPSAMALLSLCAGFNLVRRRTI